MALPNPVDIGVCGYVLMPEDSWVGHNTSDSVGYGEWDRTAVGFWALRPLSLIYLPASFCPVSLAPLPLHLRALGGGPRRAPCPDVLMGLSKDDKGFAVEEGLAVSLPRGCRWAQNGCGQRWECRL